ncbi:MAG TPA: YqcI/YcgG family protein, partial [Chthoniobacterales bacterium]
MEIQISAHNGLTPLPDEEKAQIRPDLRGPRDGRAANYILGIKRESNAAFAIKARSAFRARAFDGKFPWLGDKAAWNEKSCGFGVFDAMATKEATRELSYQLYDFAHSAKMKAEPGSRFVAIFHRPLQLTQREFEACLWMQLWQLHRFDPSEWDATVSADPADPHF